MEYLGYIASLAMGIVLGLMGGGGSILTVPILVYLFSLSPILATGYSLFIVGITSLIGGAMYIRKKQVDFQTVYSFALPSVIGVNISRGIIIPHIPSTVAQVGSFTISKEVLIMAIFACLMILASYSMMKKKNYKKPTATSPVARTVLLAVQGLLVGAVAGFVGAGGGFLIIPALVSVAGLSMRIAVGTSLLIIAFQSLLGFAGDVTRGLLIDWYLLGTIAAMAVVGIIIGSAFSHKIDEQKLKYTFGWLVLFMGLTVLIEQLRHF